DPGRRRASRPGSRCTRRRVGAGQGGMSTEVAPRLVTVWCPEWPTIAARADPHRPAAVFHANRVIACTPAARAAGVSHGDRRRTAQAACPELQVIERDPDRDAREFEPIVRAVADLAPRI